MLNAGVHTLPLAEYLADPAPKPSLSSSVAHVLVTQSAYHARARHPRLNPAYESEDAPNRDLGSAVHDGVLEGGKRICFIEASDWRKDKTKSERDIARVNGLIPLLLTQKATVESMVLAVHNKLLLSEFAHAWQAGGDVEQTLLWQESDIWCRCRPDWLSKDRRLCLSLKTTAGSAEPNTFTRSAVIPHGYDMQAAMESRGIVTLCRPASLTYAWIVVECEPPHAVSLVGLEPAFLELAEKKLRWAMVRWEKCIRTGEWPGYPARVAYMALPPWAETQWAEREGIL